MVVVAVVRIMMLVLDKLVAQVVMVVVLSLEVPEGS